MNNLRQTPRPETGSKKPPLKLSFLASASVLLLPLLGHADHDRHYHRGEVEFTVGVGNGRITFGKTWGDRPERVVVKEKVIVKERPRYEEERVIIKKRPKYDEEVIVIKKRPRKQKKKVIIYEDYDREYSRCDRPRKVVKKVIIKERKHRRKHRDHYREETVVYQKPHKRHHRKKTVIYRDSRDYHHEEYYDHKPRSRKKEVVRYKSEPKKSRKKVIIHKRPKELFPDSNRNNPRPRRHRGVSFRSL